MGAAKARPGTDRRRAARGAHRAAFLLLLSVAACTAFSGTNAMDDVADNPDGAVDATVAKDGALDAGDGKAPKLACDTVDASTFVVPTGMVVCNADAGLTSTDTDQKNCGWCGHDCGGAQCTAGFCASTLVLAAAGPPLNLFALAGSDLYYFADFADPTLYKSPKAGADGGTAIANVGSVAQMAYRQLYGPVVRADRFYGHLAKQNFSLALDGQDLLLFPSSGNLISVPPFVFVAGPNGLSQYQGDGAATGLSVPSQSTAYDLAATPDGSTVFWIERAGGGDADAGDSGLPAKHAVLWRDTTANAVALRLYEFPAPTNASGGYSLIAASDQFVFFVEGGTGDLLRLPVDTAVVADGGITVAPVRVWQAHGANIQELVVRGGRVYFTVAPVGVINFNVRELRFVSECGGPEYTLVKPRYAMNGLQLDGTDLYWGDDQGLNHVRY